MKTRFVAEFLSQEPDHLLRSGIESLIPRRQKFRSTCYPRIPVEILKLLVLSWAAGQKKKKHMFSRKKVLKNVAGNASHKLLGWAQNLLVHHQSFLEIYNICAIYTATLPFCLSKRFRLATKLPSVQVYLEFDFWKSSKFRLVIQLLNSQCVHEWGQK